jgi:IMP dehydrogenase
MVSEVKEHKAGFVESDSNLAPSATLGDALALRRRTGHSTIAITEGGQPHSEASWPPDEQRFLGIQR